LETVPVEESAREPLSGTVGVRLNDVTFAYADGDAPVLSGFDFDFKPGTVTAVLGETGAGKTTLIRLILALLKPSGGSVEFYSADRVLPASERTRCNLVYVPQGNTLLSGTVRDNLKLGNPLATDAQMAEVLRLCCADFVLEHRDGLDMSIGEDGEGLSEGQAQRICIARSLLREGQVVVFDEATSSLDPKTENTLLENMIQWAAAKCLTVIFVTHRESVSQVCSDACRL